LTHRIVLPGLWPRYQAGKPPWLAPLLHELLAFPNARNDDQVDSVSQFLKWAEADRYRRQSAEIPYNGSLVHYFPNGVVIGVMS
jgi:hypothetical protein